MSLRLLIPALVLMVACTDKSSSDDDDDGGGGLTDSGGSDTGAGDDVDGDGYVSEAAGGDDCDDTDATVNPGATETWYDGVDSDCDGANDNDADVDGFDAETAGGDDCDDTDATVNPDATEVWYDGVDGDCDGADDDDADGDGYAAESADGRDCDDTDADISPSAEEVWYDGIDSDCDDESDYDADLDGFDSDAYGGEDCDDDDFNVSPEALEWLGDDLDDDCDGDPDTAWFKVLDTTGFTGIRGVDLGERIDDGELVIAVLADEIPDASGSARETGGGTWTLPLEDITSAPDAPATWYWGEHTLGDGLGFATDGEYEVWAYTMLVDGVSTVVADPYDRDGDTWTSVLIDTDATTAHSDVSLSARGDGGFDLLACHADTPALVWMYGSPAEYYANTHVTDIDDDLMAQGSTCVAVGGAGIAIVGDGTPAAQLYGLDADTGLSWLSDGEFDSPVGHMASDGSSGGAGVAYAQGASGGSVYVLSADGDELDASLTGGDYDRVSLFMDDLDPWVTLIDADGTVDVYGGDISALSPVSHLPGLTTVDQAELWLTSDGQQVLVVRGGDEVVYSIIGVP